MWFSDSLFRYYKAEKHLYNVFTSEVLERVVQMIYDIFPEVTGMSRIQFTHMFQTQPENSQWKM